MYRKIVRILKEILPCLVLFSISLTFTLLYTYQSPYLIGADTQKEYEIFLYTLINGQWGIYTDNVINSCLSVSVLPHAVYKILNVNALVLYKTLYPVIASFIPPVVYFTARKYLNIGMSFVAGMLVLTSSCHIWAASYARNVTGLLLFSIAVLLVTRDYKYKNWCVASLLAVAILDYYAIGLMIAVIIYLHYAVGRITGSTPLIGYGAMLFIFALMFYWYAWVNSYVMYDLFRSAFAGIKSGEININILDMQQSVTYMIMLLAVGVITILGYYACRNKYNLEYKTLIIVASIIMLIAVVTPDFEILYGIGRLQYMLTPIFAVPFIQGVHSISSRNKYLKYATWVILVIAILFVAYRVLPADPSNIYPYGR